MKTRLVSDKDLAAAGRWDIDYHLPPIEIGKFHAGHIVSVRDVADIVSVTFDPGTEKDVSFKYIDIASVDVSTGVITNPQELTGEEAPSRARKVVRAYDIVISTCRPTRGAIAIVPDSLHGEICSTGFSVVRPKQGTNPIFLHFVLRLESTKEQFRKWSTGSSYPAILDDDVCKTLIPMPPQAEQDAIAAKLIEGLVARERQIRLANEEWERVHESCVGALKSKDVQVNTAGNTIMLPTSCSDIELAKGALPTPRRELVTAKKAIQKRKRKKKANAAKAKPLFEVEG